MRCVQPTAQASRGPTVATPRNPAESVPSGTEAPAVCQDLPSQCSVRIGPSVAESLSPTSQTLRAPSADSALIRLFAPSAGVATRFHALPARSSRASSSGVSVVLSPSVVSRKPAPQVVCWSIWVIARTLPDPVGTGTCCQRPAACAVPTAVAVKAAADSSATAARFAEFMNMPPWSWRRPVQHPRDSSTPGT